MLCLPYLRCTNTWNTVQSDTLCTPAPLFSLCPSLSFSCLLSLVFSLVFAPVLTRPPASDLVFLSLSWLASTPFRGQSPRVRKEKKTHACTHTSEHKWTHEIICKHRHAHWHADACHTQTDTQLNTRAQRQTCCIHTQALTSKVLQHHAFSTYTW